MTLFDRFIDAAIKRGTLAITYADGRVARFGTAEAGFPDVAIAFTAPGVPRAIALRPDMGAGEAYMDGRMTVANDDIIGLIGLIGLNNPWERGLGLREHGLARRAVRDLKGRVDRLNWSRKSKRNVAHHYDLDDRLYDLFLDENRQYSCAYWPSSDPTAEHDDLDRAQVDKMAHIAAKLALKPGQRVLDIGCGWGGMAIYLARTAGVEVLGVTLSEEQLKVARRSAADAGLSDRVTFELIDYRAVTGRFDRIVSVGMFEHVGPRHYRQFFAQCARLLADDGVMLLHTIGRMGGAATTDAWTAKYIFPGGYCPALSEIVAGHEGNGLILTDVEVLRLHYARTLRHWYARVMARRAEIEALYDPTFFRMWQFYLAGSAVSFETGSLCNYQLQYTKSRRALPITRDYIADAERTYQETTA